MAPIFVYQMGKVGSSTITESLKSLGINFMHIHRFYFSNSERPLSFRDRLYKLKCNFIFNKHRLVGKQKKIKIITFYRDPLARNISSFFQNLEYFFTKKEIQNLDFNILEKKFNKSVQIHDTPNNWFDLELKRKTGIDVYKYPFNKEKGYSIIKEGIFEILICNTDHINNLENEIGNFLEVKNFKILLKNIGEKKWYKELYKEFKEKYTPKREIIEKLYSSKTIKHFFQEKIILEKKTHWLLRCD